MVLKENESCFFFFFLTINENLVIIFIIHNNIDKLLQQIIFRVMTTHQEFCHNVITIYNYIHNSI